MAAPLTVRYLYLSIVESSSSVDIAGVGRESRIYSIYEAVVRAAHYILCIIVWISCYLVFEIDYLTCVLYNEFIGAIIARGKQSMTCTRNGAGVDIVVEIRSSVSGWRGTGHNTNRHSIHIIHMRVVSMITAVVTIKFAFYGFITESDRWERH